MNLSRTTLADQVAKELITRIERDGLRPGDEIPPESELAQEFGVNRLVVREAVRTLVAREILISSQGRPSRVSVPSARVFAEMLDFRVAQQSLDLDDLLETRRLIECELARLAAERVNRGVVSIDSASEILDQMAESAGDRERFVELDVRFHALIAEASGATFLQLILSSLESVLLRARRSTYATRERRNEGHDAAVTAHGHILRAVRAGQPAEAAAAMEEHLRETQRDVSWDG
ncbi:GntR family transcriptional repressor for pyruvate dehydrogenase complex [Haloactinopolyspora alba]|uniref:GntR family transcriptional repressor for pyruvate dehydrogenase complex n=1 Tax=Haloactinopolyspora alba TaxID=648780 RepID=A0A2P8DT38_9ACTN|nr:FCD domain-containing protein [Haloactinopolyspora alba]PSL00379.1 GntR family transcriptional repressor for pyruvate dehydrogenase complex [Haloactinopolyspora alba]